MAREIDDTLTPRHGANFAVVDGPIRVRSMARSEFPSPDTLLSGTFLAASDENNALYCNTDGTAWVRQSGSAQGRIYVRNWNVLTSYTLTVGSSSVVIPENQRAWVDITQLLDGATNADLVALEAQRSASRGLDYMVEGSYYTGPLATGVNGVQFIDHLARLAPAGYTHRVAWYRLSTAGQGQPQTLISVIDSTRGSEIFYDSLSSRNFFRAPDDAYSNRIMSRGTQFYWSFNRTAAFITEPNQGWDLLAARTAVPQSTSPLAFQPSIIPCSYGHSFFWNNTANNIRCSVLTAEDLTTMTLQYWFKPTSTFAIDITNSVGDGNTNSTSSQIATNTSGFLVVYFAGTARIASLAPLVLDQTYMVTLKVEGGVSSLYLNGVFQGSYAALFPHTSSFFQVGRSNSSMWFQSLSIIKSAVSDADILADYNAGISSPA